MPAQIALFCIDFHTAEDTLRFLQSLRAQAQQSVELHPWVIDNGGEPRSQALHAKSGEDSIRVLSAPDNLGYFGGAAWGLTQYLAQAPQPDWVIVSNPDIAFEQADFFEQLHARHAESGAMVVAPAIVSERSGNNQNPFMRSRPTRQRMRFYREVFRTYPGLLAYETAARVATHAFGRLPRRAQSASQLRTVYAGHGSFMAFHRSYFEAGCGLQPGAFLYLEEIFVAETVRRAAGKVLYDPQLRVEHRQHASTGLFKSRTTARFVRDAQAHYYDAYFR